MYAGYVNALCGCASSASPRTAPLRRKRLRHNYLRGAAKRTCALPTSPACAPIPPAGAPSNNPRVTESVRHRIDDVIDSQPVGQRGKSLRVTRIVGMFPCVADMHVMADRHHDPPFIVANRPPLRLDAVPLVGSARADVLISRNLKTFVQIVEHVENFVFVLQVFYRPVRENLAHANQKSFPLGLPMETVHH